MEENKEHIKAIDDIIDEGLKMIAMELHCNGAVADLMRNAFRKVASAAMMDGFDSGYQIGYDSGYSHGSETNS